VSDAKRPVFCQNKYVTDENLVPTDRGLSHEEAARRLKTGGYNELPSEKRNTGWKTFLNVLREPMLALLVGTGVVYLFLGETTDALLLSSFIVFVVGITFYQEHKTDRALSALKQLSSPRALVVRSGEQRRISGREVVCGDLCITKEGDRVPADGYVLAENNLLVDESLLTGESVPVQKRVWNGAEKEVPPGGNNTPFVFSGTLVVGGRATMRVYATAANTQVGKIGVSLARIEDEEMLLRKETKRIIRTFMIIAVSLCSLVVVLWGVTRGNWMQGILAGLTFAMSMLPEEFPVVLAIFLTLGAWRLSKRQILIRHSSAIETLGAATVLCVDKTGTLTENRMKLQMLHTNKPHRLSDDTPVPRDYHELLLWGALASAQDPFDPVEKELRLRAYTLGDTPEALREKPVREYPRTDTVSAVSYVYGKNQEGYRVAAKGSPEAIAGLCHLDEPAQAMVSDVLREMAMHGLRVLAVARATWGLHELPQKQEEFSFSFLGMVGFADPIRSGSAQALAEAYQAGIRVIMLTGDYPGTAQAIARDVGLKNPESYMVGEELGFLNHLELREKVKSTNIFARIQPEQKLLLVNALKANGEIVAMTGDGVNDAPALKAAHIGISMGGRGTDVAREASDIVLIDDNFSSIVRAVRTGRKIYENIKKAMLYIVAVHVPIAGMTLAPILLGLPIVLLPAHIAFLELIIDPACSTVFEAEHAEADIMKQPPRALREPTFSKQTLLVGLMQGTSVLGIVFCMYMGALLLGVNDTHARTLAFTTLVFGNLTLIVTNLSWKRTIVAVLHHATPALRMILAGVICMLIGALYVPKLRFLFHFSPLSFMDLLVTLAAGSISLLWFELLKATKMFRNKQTVLSYSGRNDSG